LDTGLLVEVWDKGMLWDKAIGYYWAPLQTLQCCRVVSEGMKDDYDDDESSATLFLFSTKKVSSSLFLPLLLVGVVEDETRAPQSIRSLALFNVFSAEKKEESVVVISHTLTRPVERMSPVERESFLIIARICLAPPLDSVRVA